MVILGIAGLGKLTPLFSSRPKRTATGNFTENQQLTLNDHRPPLVSHITTTDGERPVVESNGNHVIHLESRLRTDIRQTQSLDPTLNNARLDQLAHRLSSITDDSSIDKIAVHLRNQGNVSNRAIQPNPLASSEGFDVATAQLHQVKRIQENDNTWKYVAVLLDAHGRTRMAKLTDAEGERQYALMKKIESNPLLEKVYRQIVMPMLDKLLSREQTSATE